MKERKKLSRKILRSILRRLYRVLRRWEENSTVRSAKFAAMSDELALSEAHDLTLVISSRDKVIGSNIYIRRQFDFSKFERAYEIFGLAAYSSKLTLLDIGANIGTTGLAALRKELVSECLFFEPEPTNARILRANIALNGLEDRCRVFNVALGESKREVDLELSPDNFGDHRVRTDTQPKNQDVFNEHQREVTSVSMQCLDSYLDDIDLAHCMLWMDTQGYEGHVLSGARTLLVSNPPLVMEFWPYGMKRTGSYENLVRFCEDSAYREFIDLNDDSNTRVSLTRSSLQDLVRALGTGGAYTDILLI